jgi:hypothetical protein
MLLRSLIGGVLLLALAVVSPLTAAPGTCEGATSASCAESFRAQRRWVPVGSYYSRRQAEEVAEGFAQQGYETRIVCITAVRLDGPIEYRVYYR